MVECQPAFREPPSKYERLPELSEIMGWKGYGSVLRLCWKQLMSTPTAVASLEIVGTLDYHCNCLLGRIFNNKDDE